MSGSTIHWLGKHLLACGDAIAGEQGSNINLEILTLRIVGRIGVEHCMAVEHNAFCVLAMDYHTRAYVNRLCDTAIAYGHAVEVTSLVETQHTMFNSLVAILQCCLAIVKANGKAQRAIVEQFV